MTMTVTPQRSGENEDEYGPMPLTFDELYGDR
jgi:hypothetical protein